MFSDGPKIIIRGEGEEKLTLTAASAIALMDQLSGFLDDLLGVDFEDEVGTEYYHAYCPACMDVLFQVPTQVQYCNVCGEELQAIDSGFSSFEIFTGYMIES